MDFGNTAHWQLSWRLEIVAVWGIWWPYLGNSKSLLQVSVTVFKTSKTEKLSFSRNRGTEDPDAPSSLFPSCLPPPYLCSSFWKQIWETLGWQSLLQTSVFIFQMKNLRLRKVRWFPEITVISVTRFTWGRGLAVISSILCFPALLYVLLSTV